jgi:hypothetical protein
MFSMTSIGTPCTNNSITFVLNQMIPWINFLTRRWPDMNSRLKRAPTPTCFSQATSLHVIQLCNLFISIKWPFYQKWTLCISLASFPFPRLHLVQNPTWAFNIFSTFSLFMLPLMMTKNDTNNG